jgi:4-aminobutyrate aminotransferase
MPSRPAGACLFPELRVRGPGLANQQASASSAEIIDRDSRFVADAIKIRYTPFVIDRGEGCRLFDADGKSYLDFSSLWSVANLGYSDQTVRQAVREQIDRSQCTVLASAIHEPGGILAKRLAGMMTRQPKKVWFGLSGSDASETTQRLLLEATGKRRLISFIGSWHGTTDATMALSGFAGFNNRFGGSNIVKIPYPDPYRQPFPTYPDLSLTDQCLGYLEDVLFKTICPPDDVAAIFVEGIQADSGDIVPPDDFLPKLRALCDRHGIYLVMDEVKVGMGRTGRMFSYEHFGIEPDFVLLGKALGAGMPLSAVIGPPEVLDVGPGLALYTISGNATSCAAALAGLDVLERDDLVARAELVGAYLLDRLSSLFRHERVGDVRGKGLICGVDLVQDRQNKEPNQPLAAKVVYRAWELGLILFYAGTFGNVLEITPPLILGEAEIDEGVAILDQALDDAIQGRVDESAVAAYAGW